MLSKGCGANIAHRIG